MGFNKKEKLTCSFCDTILSLKRKIEMVLIGVKLNKNDDGSFKNQEIRMNKCCDKCKKTIDNYNERKNKYENE